MAVYDGVDVIRAIVLAAGASSRMGRPKAALPILHRADTFLARIIRVLTIAGLPDIVVVTGAAQDIVQQAAGRVGRHVRFVHNAGWQSGQLSSLLSGLNAPPTNMVEAALVTLVDVPFVSADTVRRVVHEWRVSGAPIVRPAQGPRHGHPVVFDRALFDELRLADPNAGAKTVVRAHEQQSQNIASDDPGAFVDTDTEEDYREALRRLR